ARGATLAAGLTMTSVSATGLRVDLLGFVTFTANFGFRKSGLAGPDAIAMSANSVSAKLVAGPLEVGVTGGSLALVLNQDGTKALDASGSPLFNGSGLASVSATSVHVKYKTTTTAYAARPATINIDGARTTLA